MWPIQLSVLIHIIGVGLLFTSLIGGWFLNLQYRKAHDWKSKALLLKALRPIGLLSPFAVLVMLGSGISNMMILDYGVFSASWLSTKLVVFVILVIAGVISSARGARRARLVRELAGDTSGAASEDAVRRIDRQQANFYLFQGLLLLIILILSIVKPGS